MFYQYPLPQTQGNQISVMVSLTPSESKRLIAMGIKATPEVKYALQNGLIIIARGTTSAFVAEEVMGKPVAPKSEYSRGIILDGELKVNLRRGAGNDFILKKGTIWDTSWKEAILEFTPDDVFLKGASAIDAAGNAGVLAAGTESGTIGTVLPLVMARQSHLIIPVGLEKMIPSVSEAAGQCGVFKYKYSTGYACALIPAVHGRAFTEIQALAVLAGVGTTHVASGGIAGSEGSVVLSITGNEANVEQAFTLIASIKGEPPVPGVEISNPPAAENNYDPKILQDKNIRR